MPDKSMSDGIEIVTEPGSTEAFWEDVSAGLMHNKFGHSAVVDSVHVTSPAEVEEFWGDIGRRPIGTEASSTVQEGSQ